MMTFDVAISVKQVSKCYMIYDRPQDRLKQSFWRNRKRFYHEFWALKNVSFHVNKGETVGIIGCNGSGKSTLLQIIAGILSPTEGEVQVNGRVAALLELGSGFNPEFTGHENVYMNGAVLGLTKEEIDARFDDIATFADIGQFMEQPVKTYSSGMFVRLAFAINIMSQPEIMIVDEALAVGDMNFQAKCMTALTRIQNAGATVLFVSHDIGAVKSLCSRAIHLERGELKNIGTAADVAEHYVRIMREEMNEEHSRFARVSRTFTGEKEDIAAILRPEQEHVPRMAEEFARRVAQFRYGTGETRITYVELLNMANEPINVVEFNQQVKIKIFIESYSYKAISVNFQIFDEKKILVTSSGLMQAGRDLIETKPHERYIVKYQLRLPFQDGIYSIQATVVEPIPANVMPEFLDVVPDSVVFKVMVNQPHKIWSKVYLFPTVTILRK